MSWEGLMNTLGSTYTVYSVDHRTVLCRFVRGDKNHIVVIGWQFVFLNMKRKWVQVWPLHAIYQLLVYCKSRCTLASPTDKNLASAGKAKDSNHRNFEAIRLRIIYLDKYIQGCSQVQLLLEMYGISVQGCDPVVQPETRIFPEQP